MEMEQTRSCTIHTRQKGVRSGLAPNAWIEATTDWAPHGTLLGKMLREDVVKGVRYIAVRWTGHGVATYLAPQATHEGTGHIFKNAILIHWGL